MDVLEKHWREIGDGQHVKDRGEKSPREAIRAMDADVRERAKRAVVLLYGNEVYEREIGTPLTDLGQEYWADKVFELPPTPARLSWVATVTGYANKWDEKVKSMNPLEREIRGKIAREALLSNGSEILRQSIGVVDAHRRAREQSLNPEEVN